jgi:hypothetical protein
MKKSGKEIRSIQDELRKELETLKERVDPPSGFKISTKGKAFTLPDGSSSDGPLTCVILDWVTAYTWFEGIYNPKDPQPPQCFALGRVVNDLRPSDKAPKKQGGDDGSCKKCAFNQWGSDPGGGKGKACKNMRRLLIVPVDADETTQPWVIDVSPTGLKHFDKYVNTLSDNGKHPIEVVTDIEFEASEPFPSLRFKPVDVNNNIETSWALKEHGQEILLQEPKLEDAA